MRILLVTNMYPNEENPYYGIFVKEQIESINRYYPDIAFDVFFINGKKSRLEYIKSIFKIHKKINREKYDLIHIHYGASGLFLIRKLKKKIPIVVTLHGGDIQIAQKKRFQVYISKRVISKSNYTIYLNDDMEKIVRPICNKSAKIPCSVNINIFKPRDCNKVYKEYKIIFPSDKNRVVKNYPLFNKTINILKSKYNIPIHEIELKNINRIDLAKIFQEANVMLMTSISEGSPQVVKEAMACNLPVVSTNVGDVSYLLSNVKNSAVVSEANENELANQVYRAINNEIPGIDGFNKIIELGLDDKSIAERIVKIYNELTKNNNK